MPDIVIYKAKDGRIELQVNLSEETVWLTQKQLSDLFDKNVRTISEHINNIFNEDELDAAAVIRNFRITAADGKSYDTKHYNLDVIISVGYRVHSKRGTEFRQWSTAILKEYLIKGYTLNEKRLAERGIDVFLPKRSVLRTWSDRKKKDIEPLFRSYIFAKVNELGRLDVLRDDAVLTTIRDAEGFAQLRPEEIDALQHSQTDPERLGLVDFPLPPVKINIPADWVRRA